MKKVLLTGASGYIGSWIAKKLLAKGHQVHATVRDLQNQEKTSHLSRLANGTSGSIQLFQADLLQSGSFDEAMKGCDAVIHCASPFLIGKIKNAQRQLIDPALKGTRNVLQSATKESSVTQVIVTSSMAAMYGDTADIPDYIDGEVSEKSWNTTSTPTHKAYSYSKTVAEKEAWKLSNGASWKLKIINPGLVLGPSLSQRKDSASVEIMSSMINGKYKMGVPDISVGLVDVRDVAEAHVRALEIEERGRFLTAGTVGEFITIADIIRELRPGKYPLPKSVLPKALLYLAGPSQGFSWKFTNRNYGYKMKLNNTRVRKAMNLSFIELKQSIADHLEQIERDGLVS